jgi:hypothetical protein
VKIRSEQIMIQETGPSPKRYLAMAAVHRPIDKSNVQYLIHPRGCSHDNLLPRLPACRGEPSSNRTTNACSSRQRSASMICFQPTMTSSRASSPISTSKAWARAWQRHAPGDTLYKYVQYSIYPTEAQAQRNAHVANRQPLPGLTSANRQLQPRQE